MDAYIITGPTSGIGRATTIELADKTRVLVLVGRGLEKLQRLQTETTSAAHTEIVQCDFSDITSCRQAAVSVIELCRTKKWHVRSIVNNAGLQYNGPERSAQGWDMTFGVNTLGTLAFAEALLPSLDDGAQVLFVASKTEDPSQLLPRRAGLRGGRFISAEASAHGNYDQTSRDGGPSKIPGADAYATSKQCILACSYALAREYPRLRINAVEPGWIPETGLGRNGPFVLSIIARYVLPFVTPYIDGASTVPKAAKLLASIVLDSIDVKSGGYFGEKGQQMQPSILVQAEQHQNLVLAQCRALLTNGNG